ncbi:hypothetical protein QOT17_012648 [Balamuthia mandrillaris]
MKRSSSSSSSSSSQDNIRNFLQWIERGQQQQQQQHQRPLLVSVQPSTVAIRSGGKREREGDGDGAEVEVDAGYGLYTRVGGLKEGDLLVSIPGRLILDANTVLATAVGKALKQLCHKKKQKKQNRKNATGAEEEETVFALDEDVLLRVFLWREKNKLELKQQQRSATTATAEEREGEEEWWQPWLRVMDPTVHGLFAAAMRVHLQWNEEEEKEEGSTEKKKKEREQELQRRIESSLAEGTQHRAYALDFVRHHYLPLYRQWKWLQSNLFSVRKDLFPSSMPSTQSWMNYCWAAHWILSHNVKRPQPPRDKRLKAVSKALVPLVDFCNHSPMTLSTPILGDEQKEDNAHGVSISIHVHEQLNGNKNEEKAEKKKRVLAMGEEVFINYGFGENALLLSHYGFALLEPPIRQLAFRVDVDGHIVERGEEKYFAESSSPTRKEDDNREKNQEDKEEGMHSPPSFREQKMELLEMIGYGSVSPSSSMEELFFVRPLLSSLPSSSSIAPPENRQMLFAIIASLKEDHYEHVQLLHLLQRRTKELLSTLHSESEEEEEEKGGRGGMLGCGFVDDRTMMMEEVLDDEEVIEKEIERNQRWGLQFFLTALQRWLEEQPTSIQEDEEKLRILEEAAKASRKSKKHGDEAERGGRVRLEEEKMVGRWMVVYRLVRKRLCQEAIHCFTHCCQSL